MKVCEKVQRKQITSYNEVADELVSEISDETTEGEMGVCHFILSVITSLIDSCILKFVCFYLIIFLKS